MREDTWAVGEDDVVLGEGLVNESRGGNDNDITDAEFEGEDRAVGLGEAVERAVEGLVEEMEVADDREL